MLNTFEETFQVTEMRTFKHEPFFIVGGGGGGLILVVYGNKVGFHISIWCGVRRVNYQHGHIL